MANTAVTPADRTTTRVRILDYGPPMRVLVRRGDSGHPWRQLRGSVDEVVAAVMSVRRGGPTSAILLRMVAGGLGLQLVGIFMAASALVVELHDKPKPTVTALEVDRRRRRKRENPWSRPASKVLNMKREAHRRSIRLQQNIRLGGRGSSGPSMGELVEKGFDKYRALAADDWERQAQLNEELREHDRLLLTQQLELLQEPQVATRKRVLVEMVGLLFVALGTAL